MDRTALRQALGEMLEEETGQTYPALDEGTSLRDGLGLDSVDVVSLVIQIQSRFRIQITTEELEQVVRVSDLLDLLQARVGVAARAA
jgi:acyl carrier protein